MLTLCTTIVYKIPSSTVRKSTLQNVNSSNQKCAIKPIVLSTQVGGVGGCNFCTMLLCVCSKCYSLASPRTLAVAMPEFRRVYAAVCATPRHSTHAGAVHSSQWTKGRSLNMASHVFVHLNRKLPSMALHTAVSLRS